MVQIIAHRCNTIQELEATPIQYGVEVDLRSDGNYLYLHHEPFKKGVLFDDWLKHFNHASIILNVKEEGLEERLIVQMERVGCENFFFLDQSFPFLVKTSQGGERRSAVRISEFEGLCAAEALAGRVEWVWIDCFTSFPVTREEVNALVDWGYKICIVSPELQGRGDLLEYRTALEAAGVEYDAVCTKHPQAWS